ncbi:MAG: PEP-CTERM sorting domain-containing protein [Chthonomonas sp.]|nr:PEP-CTERM sorting domain-containing protein [Chthonomonas sp.]
MKLNKAWSLILTAAVAGTAHAGLSSYSQNFESLNAASPTALSGDGWKIFANVFNPSGGYLYGYGVFPAPNGGAGFSAIAGGEGGANQGSQYINTYSDYNNGDHANGNRIEANIFQEQVIGSADLAQTYTFKFDYKASSMFGPNGSTTTGAFIKVLNPFNGYSLEAFPLLNTTTASGSVWSENNTLSININNNWNGYILQFGFINNATQYQGSGMYYDNISFGAVPEPSGILAMGLGAFALLRKRSRR